MTRRKKRLKKKKYIQYGLRTGLCLLLLTVTVLGVHGLNYALGRLFPASEEAAVTAKKAAAMKEIGGLLASLPVPADAGNNAPGSSHTLSNTPIENVASLDNTNQDWGQGVDSDEQNRPYSALSYQEKYSQYNANFIVPDSNKIYLTLDEGYEYGCTPALLDTLKEKQVSAVFFVTKSYAKSQPDYIRRMIEEGHAIGNHSVTHPADGLPSQTIEQQQLEVTDNHNYIKENFDYEMHLFRYPAGKFSEQSLAIINNCNYKSVFWSFAYLDYDVNNQPDQKEALDKLVSRLHPGAIYLLHAESETNAAILGDFIDQARAAGYEFALFD